MTRALLMLVTVCGACGPLDAQGEPAHGGKTLSEWVELMDQNPGSHGAVSALGEIGEPALAHLIRAMRTHPDGAIRWLTHLAVAKIGEVALPELDRIMEDGDPTARMQAVLAFEEILGREAIPRLQEAVKDEHPFPRVRAHGALIRLGEPPEEHVPAMTELLLDAEAGVQWLTAESLGWCGASAAGAEGALLEATQRFPGAIADRAWQALEEIGTEGAMTQVYERWAQELQNPDTELAEKLKAAAEVGRKGPAAAAALPHLRAIAADGTQDLLLRGYAAWAAEQVEPSEGPGRTYHVAQNDPAASDDNPGTEEKPWKTIRRAAETLRPGDTALIHGGEYREFVQPFLGGTSYDRTITYAAAPGEQPVLKGSDIWQPAWRDEGNGLWSAPYQRHAWDYPEDWPTAKEGPMHRAEQVFVGGKLLRHVATLKELKPQAGRMYTDDDGGRLWVHITGSPTEHLVERSTRQQVFAPAVRGLGHIRVRGLTMRHAAAPESNAANWGVISHRAVMSVRAGHHWIIEDNTIEWGNAQGLDVGGEGWGSDVNRQPVVCETSGFHHVRRNNVSHHGVAGIVGWGGGENELLLEDNVTNHNCLKGNFWQYEAAGVKLHNAKDCIIRRHRSHANEAFGIWLDHQCERNRITQCILTDNVAAGVFHEVSAGPILIDSNVIIGTRSANDSWGDGIYSHDGNHATCANNFIYGCESFGVRFRNLFSRIADGKPTTTSHNRVFNNFIFDCARGAVSFNPEVPKAEDNHSDHNILWQKGEPIVMQLEDSGSGVKWEETTIGRALGNTGGGDISVPLEQWQEHVGNDRHSVALPPSRLFGGKSPEEIRQMLATLWPADAPGLDEGYGELQSRPVSELLAVLAPDLSDRDLEQAARQGLNAGP